MEVSGRTAEPSAHCLTLTTSDFVTWSIFYHDSFKAFTNQHTCIFNNLKTEFQLPLYFFQNHSLSSMSACFQLVSLTYAEFRARGRTGSVVRLGDIPPNSTIFNNVRLGKIELKASTYNFGYFIFFSSISLTFLHDAQF